MRIKAMEWAQSGHILTPTLREKVVPGKNIWPMAGLGAVVLLAGVLHFANLSSLGYVNHYYTAATVSMLQSWHNFFFAAAEPGGAVSVDKPPVGLWLQAISAFIFGVNTFGVLLPELLAGMLSVVVLYHLVARRFGSLAGLVAGLALAITPVVIATDRNNTIDGILILTLLLATWAFIKATETGRLKYLLLGAGLVGIGFNIKMLQAFLPLPAFYGLYFLGSAERVWRKIGRLVLATLVILVISLSWVTVVDLTPAGQRPYVGSSGDNTETSLIVGYNGLQRLLGRGSGGGAGNRPTNGPSQQAGPGRNPGTNPGTQPSGPRGNGGFAQRGPGNGSQGGFQPGGAAAGFSQTGQAGILRLFTTPLSKEASWLLPFGLLSGLLLLVGSRPRWPISPKHQAAVLWGGWLLTGGVFFSVAGFFHEYYLSMLAAPIAALVGLGVGELWQLRQRGWSGEDSAERSSQEQSLPVRLPRGTRSRLAGWLALAFLLVAVGATLALQINTAQTFVKTIWWLPVVVGMFLVGVVLSVLARSRSQQIAGVGFACIVAAMLITPGIWSVLTMLNPGVNQSLPAAYNGQTTGADELVGLKVDQELLAYLEANTEGTKYLMAVPSSMQGSDYVIASGRPVLYLGGFMGQDQVETGPGLAQLVANGELRYIYWNSLGSQRGGMNGGGQSDISNWVASSCTAVQGFDTVTRNMGAPGGTSRQTTGGATQNMGSLNITLYDCASK